MHQVYDHRFFETRGPGDETMGFAVAPLIGALSPLIGMIKGLFSACKPGQACGLAGIQSFTSQAIQTLQSILAMLQGGQITPTDAITNAQKVAAALGDPQYVYQAKKGKDAAALQAAKSQAAQLVQQIQSVAATIKPPAAAGSIGGIGSGTLLLVGGGLLAVFLLKK